MKKTIKELRLDDFTHVIPYKEFEKVLQFHCGKKEIKHFSDFMIGQTVSMLEAQAGIYATDIIRFLNYRRKGLVGKKMPLDD